MSKKVLVPIANGIEEIETACITDVLKRAEADVIVASVEKALQVTASRGLRLLADHLIADCVSETYDLVALPGGMPGAEHLRDSKALETILRRQHQEGRLYAAICASPAIVLQHHGLLEGYQATCHPEFAHLLNDADSRNNRIVADGNCITSQGPGTALEFALKLLAMLYDEDMSKKVAGPMLVVTF